MPGNLQIDLAPLLPWQVIAILGATALGVVLLGVLRRARGIGWRALAAAALAIALVNPSLIDEERSYLDDVAVVIVDDSASQKVGERESQTAETLAAVEARLARLPNTEVRVVRAGGGGDAAESGTRLFEALSRAIADVPGRRLAGVILISDGQIHDVPADPAALGFAAPVHLLLTGADHEGDRRLTVGKAPTYGLVGDDVAMTIRVDDLPGEANGATTQVALFQDGEAKEIIPVVVGADHELTVHLDHPGPTVFELKVEPGPRELSLVNNGAAVVVNGVRDRLRVLLVSGEPHAGERTWRNILKSDPAVDLVHFTILRPPEKQDGTPINELSLIAFPIRELFEVKLDEFDLIIFDRYRRRGVLPRSYFENIAQYVEAGGALLDAAGVSSNDLLGLNQSPLGRVLPSEPSGTITELGYKPEITEIGRKHPVTSDLPGGGEQPTWGRWFRLVDASVKRGVTVMTGPDNKPLLVLDHFGKGRVAQLMTDQIWLWSRGFEGGGPQAELLRRIAHWLMKEPELEEEDLRATVIAGRLEFTRRSLGQNPTEVEITTPAGEKITAALVDIGGGRANGAVPALESGLYRVSDGTKLAFAASGEINPLELADLRSTGDIIKPIAEATGGGIIRLSAAGMPDIRQVRADRDTAGRGWIGLRTNNDFIVTGVDHLSLLPPFAVLLLVLGGTLLAWRREGR
ncbi:MAG: hypothetical protein ACREEE_04615 [Dongiaceae bacterium]